MNNDSGIALSVGLLLGVVIVLLMNWLFYPEFFYFAPVRFFQLTESQHIAQWISAFAAILAVGVSLWAVTVLKKTLSATRAAVGVTEEIGKKTIKGYLSLESPTIVIEDNRWIELQTHYQNIGQTALTKVRLSQIVRVTTLEGRDENLSGASGYGDILGGDTYKGYSVAQLDLDDLRDENDITVYYSFAVSALDVFGEEVFECATLNISKIYKKEDSGFVTYGTQIPAMSRSQINETIEIHRRMIREYDDEKKIIDDEGSLDFLYNGEKPQ